MIEQCGQFAVVAALCAAVGAVAGCVVFWAVRRAVR